MTVIEPDFIILRPALALRIGVTGGRDLSGMDTTALSATIKSLLEQVHDRVKILSLRPEVSDVYRAGKIDLRLLSPLALGADQLVAKAALAVGNTETEAVYRLETAFPFERADYIRDWDDTPEHAAEFLRLAKAGEPALELDGTRDAEGASYQTIGRYVVRNSDILIAIWDGSDEKGRGGTAQIVRYAAIAGVPVVWFAIDQDATASGLPTVSGPLWISSHRDLNHLQDLLTDQRHGDASATAELNVFRASFLSVLCEMLEAAILPPKPHPPHAHGFFQRCIHILLGSGPGRRLFPLHHPHRPPLREFLNETRKPERALWKIYNRFLDFLSGSKSGEGGGTVEPTCPLPFSPVWDYWDTLYHPADELAKAYASRYRSSYVIVFALAAIALVLATFGVIFHSAALAAAEIIVLLVMASLVAMNITAWWQQKLVGYRLLAELFRKQQGLSLLGWSIPIRSAVDISSENEPLQDHSLAVQSDGSPTHWLAWYFKAMVRAAPRQTGKMSELAPQAIVLLRETLIEGQSGYHRNRARKFRKASERLERWGTIAFLATIVIVALELVLKLPAVATAPFWSTEAESEEWRHIISIGLGMSAIILPTLSAALVGFRSYAELELLEIQSLRMSRVVTRADADVGELKRRHKSRSETAQGPIPLLSQELAEIIGELSDEMLKDLDGWTQIARVKAVEAG